MAYVPENSQAGTKVFKVEAFDPDDPNTSNGKIVYSLPDDGNIIRKLFQIDPVTGILSTKVKLGMFSWFSHKISKITIFKSKNISQNLIFFAHWIIFFRRNLFSSISK